MTRNCWMSCKSLSSANGANSRVASPRRLKRKLGSRTDVYFARNRRLADFFRAALLPALGAGGGRVAFADGAEGNGAEPSWSAFRVARFAACGVGGHHVRFCGAVVSITGTPFDR